MTATSIKDVGSVLSAQQVSGVGVVRSGTSSKSSFQQIWYNQSGKDFAADAKADTKADSEQTVKKMPGDSMKAKEEHLNRTKESGQSDEDDEPKEVTSKQLEDVMALLGTSAESIVDVLASVLNVDVQDVQDAMQELGLNALDVLDAQNLTQLFLNLTGEDDLSALVTDGELYEDYSYLMDQLQAALTEVGEELDLEPQVISDILAKPEKQVTEAAAPIVEQTANTAGTDERVQETERPVDAQQTIPETLAQAQPEESSQTNGQKTASDSQSSLGGSRHQTAEQGQINNLFLENLKTEQFQPEGTQTVSETSGWSQETMDIMNQVLDYMKVTVKADTQNLEMQLHPENLGTLQIHLASKGGTVTANFITQNEAVKSALESQMIQLKENFEEQGIKVNAIEVTVQAHEFERNLEQGQGGNNRQQEPAKRTRLRRINLEEALPAEDIEQEDALTADIMAAAGNTVDYTA